MRENTPKTLFSQQPLSGCFTASARRPAKAVLAVSAEAVHYRAPGVCYIFQSTALVGLL
jgi:hypothetical protein